MYDAPSFDRGISPKGNNSNKEILSLADLQPEGTGVETVTAPIQPLVIDGTSPINPNINYVAPSIPSGSNCEGTGVETVTVPIQPPIIDGTSPINPQ